MDNEENKQATPNEVPEQPAEPEVDSSRDTDELKTMITALESQVNELKAQLAKQEPPEQPKADYAAYFGEYMYGKNKGGK